MIVDLMQPPVWLAALLAAAIALLAFGLRWLALSGALSAFLMGWIIYGIGGFKAVVPVLVFFVSSTLLSRVHRARTMEASTGDEKGDVRDGGQVWANGGMAMLLVLLFALVRDRWPPYLVQYLPVLFLAALAAVNADTWATELGKLSGVKPRSLSSWRPVAPGTSGAITFWGILASLVGAAVVPLSVFWWWPLTPVEFVTVTWSGFLGALLDSILGASVQGVYQDPESGAFTERRRQNGRENVRVRGLSFINNDAVNFLASLGSVLCALVLLRSIRYPFH
ncbi:MAG: DUF92 domain-containing protein [Chloroherpetonaceae bacterium]|nr:DUF92 domain-containing protein [Chthonomonadaceae bacterium]MDW8207813.1 DUF92 domain-containing protein [Chloroherpetonaceae bacterium]